jgi:hypothetical protein
MQHYLTLLQVNADKVTPQDLLGTLTLILNQLDHDKKATHDAEVKQGMATDLLQMLHKTLLQSGDQLYRSRLGRSELFEYRSYAVHWRWSFAALPLQ